MPLLSVPSARLIVLVLSAIVLPLSLRAVPVRVLAWDESIASRKLAIADSKGAKSIDAMHPSRRSEVYNLTIVEKPATVQALDRLDAEGKPTTIDLVFPAGVKLPLVLLLPDKKFTTGLRLLVLEDDLSSFSWGSTRFINASGSKLAFVCEKKPVTLPVSWDPVEVKSGGDTRNVDVELYFYDKPQRPIYTAVWERNSNERMLVFLVPGEDPRLGPVALKIVTEDRRVIAAVEASGKEAAREKPPQP